MSGLVKQNTTRMSISVVRPSANAKPRTTPIAKMNRMSAAMIDTASAARIVPRARFQPLSTASRSDLPSRTSSRSRSKNTMNESAVMPMATMSPAMPGSVSVKPTPWPSRSTMP